MAKLKQTGNDLFDLFWEAYPYRNAKKIGKKKCLAKFVLKKYDAETVQDMLIWINRDIENREAVRSKNQFYADPCDPIVFLNNDRWEDPIGIVINKTVHREAHRSKGVYGMNVKSAIAQFQDIVGHRTKAELRDNSGFMSAYNTYPEFREWAGKQTYKTYEAYETPEPVKPDITEDLPPPSKKEKLCGLYRDVVQAKADGRVEEIVQKMNKF